MNRRDTVLAFLALGAAPLPALAQPAGKVYRIGFLAGGAPPADGALRDLGYVEVCCSAPTT